MSPSYGRRRGIAIGVLAVLIVVAAFALFGGGDDADVSTVTETVTPTAPEDSKKDKKKDKGSRDGQGGAAASGAACAGTQQIRQLRASGVGCAEASSVAKQWQRRQSECNTVDNPSSPIGFKRTCTVAGYKCTATRDTASDKRKVDCRKGSGRIRFTFLP